MSWKDSEWVSVPALAFYVSLAVVLIVIGVMR